MRFPRHEAREVRFATRNGFGNHHGHVVGGFCHHGLDGIFGGDGLARLETEFGGFLGCGMRRDRKAGVEPKLAGFELLEQKIERHHLGDGCGVPQAVRIAGVQHAAGIRIDYDCRIGRVVAAAAAATVLGVMVSA